MPNHGYCKKCWWHKDGICYMQSVYTKDDSYCPDYVNRSKLNKKGTLDELISEWESKGIELCIEKPYITVELKDENNEKEITTSSKLR